MSAKKLTLEDYKEAGQEFGLPVACILAVAEVESRGAGFLKTGEPVILFERHVFSRLTKGKWDKSNPGISNRVAGGYGRVSDQHARLQEAVSLDRTNALMSASWGKFQLMGFNFRMCGYKNVQSFVNDMYKNERKHLNAFLQFVAESSLDIVLANQQWARFARCYNGPAYHKNRYDEKLEQAYKKWAKQVGTK